MIDFVLEFIGGVIELLLEPWMKKIVVKLRRRKRKLRDSQKLE